MNFGLAGDQASHRTWAARVARRAVPPRAGHCDRAAVNLNTPGVVSALFAAGRPQWREDCSAHILDGELCCFALTAPETGSDITALRTRTVCAALTEAAGAAPCEVVLASGDQITAGPTGKVHMFLMRKRHEAEMAAR